MHTDARSVVDLVCHCEYGRQCSKCKEVVDLVCVKTEDSTTYTRNVGYLVCVVAEKSASHAKTVIQGNL